jgi:hypothetical protein
MKLARIIMASILLASLTTAVRASECPPAQQLKGRYGLNLEGHTASGDPYVAVGVAQLERGTFSLELTRSENGKLRRQALAGSISSDQCAVKLTSRDDPEGFSLEGQIVAPSHQWLVTEVRSRNPVVASGALRRMGRQSCSQASLRGTYVYATQGYRRQADGAGWLPVGKTGRESFDGKGCTAYRETIKEGSVIMPDVHGLLDYAVQTDCSFHLLENGTPVFLGVLVNQGQSIPYMVLQEGVTRSGEYTRSKPSPKVMGCGRDRESSDRKSK